MLDLLEHDDNQYFTLTVRFPGDGRHFDGEVPRLFIVQCEAAAELDITGLAP